MRPTPRHAQSARRRLAKDRERRDDGRRSDPRDAGVLELGDAFTNLLVHVVFSTKNRGKDLTKEVRSELYPYLSSVAGNKGATLLAVGGGLDRVHLLLDLRPAVAPADLVNALKSNSSRWIRSRFGSHFAWQSGYAAFSVSKSVQAAVTTYIENQEQRHKRVDFESEYVSLLKKNEIKFDNDRLW